MQRSDILQKLKSSLPYMASEYRLKKIGIFGSYARDAQNNQSDIDIVAEFDLPIGLKFIEFTEYLEDILGKKIDVLTPAGIEGIRNKKIAQKIRDTVIYA